MEIFRKSFSPPLELKTDQFHLFPTSLELYRSDYAAVMSSRDLLRLWSQSEWPEDSFTAEQNRDDLQSHIQDNTEHVAYGFMLYSLDHSTCLGSAYVNPLGRVLENYETGEDERSIITDADARIDCWVSASVSLEVERHIVASLRDWFSQEWKILTLFSAREGMDRRIEIYDSLQMKRAATLIGRDPKIGLLLYR